jgi:hypothetical protein
MEQHPIPQQISSYQFRLVGDMTLKQFFQLAGGFLVALIFYSLPIMGIIKIPLAAISALLGIGLAFMPLEGRPLERWIFAFFRAIYTPTEFFWKKTVNPPKFFQDETATPAPTSASPQQEAALNQYLSSSTKKPGELNTLDQAEAGFLKKLTNLFSGISKPQSTSLPTPQASPPINTAPSAHKLEVPANNPIKIGQATAPRLVVEEKPSSVTPPAEITSHHINPVIAGEEIISTKQALFSVDAAPPNPPTTPNIVVGQVVDQDRKIIEGAIMEIRDSLGRPIRALRSNKVGHFIIVTPLDNGKYDIVTEKEGYEFTPITFEAVGDIIPPILVQGRNVSNKEAETMNQANQNTELNRTINQYGTAS